MSIWERFIFKDILSVTVMLFAVIDIVGAIPIIIAMRKKLGRIDCGRATFVASVILITFLFVGKEMLKLFGIDLPSFAIAGSIVVFCLALEMIFGIQLYKDDLPETASIVPLAFPLIAGAGTMTTLLSIRTQYNVENIITAILINMVIVYFVLKSSRQIDRALGTGGAAVLRRVFGIIVLAIAVKLFRANAGI